MSSVIMILLIVFSTALFLNGATDAVNTVTGAIASRALKKFSALIIAALFEVCGVVLSYMFYPFVTKRVLSLADFSATDCKGTVCAVCLSVVAVWAATAWALGLPTSESHGLMAAMCGCGAALGVKIDIASCTAVLVGLAVSVVLGAVFSGISVYLLSPFRERKKAQRIFCVLFLALSAFLHGAQDGQKFLALLFSTTDTSGIGAVSVCAVLMGCGTMCGGGRIVRKMGTDLTHTDLYTSTAADSGSSIALLLLSIAGIPVSTTHVKMSALASAAGLSKKQIDKKILVDLCVAWVTTFPVCGFLAYILIKWLILWDFC